MAYTTLNTTAEFGLSRFFSTIKAGFVQWVERADAQRVEPYRQRIAALKAMSDDELFALGLQRGDIELRVLNRFFYC